MCLFQMRTRRGWLSRGGGVVPHCPYPEFRELPEAARVTPTGEIVDLGTGRVRAFMPPRLLPRLTWAEEVEREEAEEIERREAEVIARERAEQERKEREEAEQTRAEVERRERESRERV